jgi:DNA-binding MarR family transcriptional regulator
VDDPTLTIARLSRLLENSAPPELSFSQYRVLGLLASGDERSTLLAARLAVAKPTLTSLVDGLVERGFVTRRSADDDRRAVHLSITTAGRAALDRAASLLGDALDDVVRRCEHPGAVVAALDELRLALDQRWRERIGDAAVGAPRGRA